MFDLGIDVGAQQTAEAAQGHLKVLGQEGAGIFIAPAVIQAEVEWQYQVAAIGQIDEVKERFYAISIERRLTHPVVSAVAEVARESLFANEQPWDK